MNLLALFVATFLLLDSTSFAAAAVAPDQHEHSINLRRKLAKPACGDGTCRKSCSACGPGSEECTTCIGSNCEVYPAPTGPTPAPPPPPPTPTCTNPSSCKFTPCCAGYTCVNNRGSKTCQLQRRMLQYTGSACNLQGPTPTLTNTVLKFFALGDSPYDEQYCTPYMGDEYYCLQDTILPAMLTRSNEADFAAHIGDIIKGDSSGNNMRCMEENVFSSRQSLFGTLEPDLDFLLAVVQGLVERAVCVSDVTLLRL